MSWTIYEKKKVCKLTELKKVPYLFHLKGAENHQG